MGLLSLASDKSLNKLSKGQLQDLVYDLLYNGPEW